MARLARAVAVGSAHHITQRGVDRQRIFFTDGDRHVYTDLLREQAAHARLRVLAYCWMPNHIHLIAVPEEPDSLAVALRRTHSRYAAYLNARRRRSGHLWQNRFFSCALDAAHLWTALRYVELNPVRAGFCARAEHYAWSSACAHLDGHDPARLLDLDFWRAEGGTERWQALLATPEEYAALRALQRCTFTGRPYAGEAFVVALEQQLGRRLRLATTGVLPPSGQPTAGVIAPRP